LGEKRYLANYGGRLKINYANLILVFINDLSYIVIVLVVGLKVVFGFHGVVLSGEENELKS
jgi:hypothetical protein